ncbi:site-specific integrase [Dysgonomonas sp. 520]|uniref:tyrosine-type recombinase/integrase n=1 Tax=Dysgonomonas sp. 520 TaxID=2302931 RepID=UPI0013D254FC|nr:site-specific integrase [Dysgonomonas sp. 520]
MYKINYNRVTIKAVLDKRFKRKSGLYSIKIQVCYLKTQKYYSTGKELCEEDWNKLSDTRIASLVQVRNAVKSSFDFVSRIVEQLWAEDGFSFDLLNMRLGRTSGETVNQTFKIKMELLRKDGQIGTMIFYQNALVSLERFAGESVAFTSITVDWLKKYENFLLKGGMQYATVGMRMRGLRTIINMAIRDNLINKQSYPFGRDKYEIKTGESIKKALTLEQINKFVNYDDNEKETEFYRDLWFFIYLCNGINAADLVKLKFKNIIDGEIYFIREKTKRTTKNIKHIRAIITPEMEAIIKKWGNLPHKSNYIFNLLLNYSENPEVHKYEVQLFIKRMNTKTKDIGNKLGIGNVTTYTARHSYATVLKRSGANISYISESLGHSNLTTTESYLASFERKEREKNAKMLTQF